VVNPDSGPGSSNIPNSDFIPQIKKLNGYSTVETIGYVRTGYQTRNISDVLADVQTYVGWAKNDTGLMMNGIFFDEVTNAFTPSNAQYLQTINSAVKSSSGFGSQNLVCMLLIRDLPR
jgi:hypothetical protein